jgi:hypothetical protein
VVDKSTEAELSTQQYALVPARNECVCFCADGSTGDFHGISPRALFTAILTDNRCETLLKVGQYDLLRHFVKTNYRNMDKLWSAVKVAMRHHYSIKETDLWCDMIETMTYLGKDILNPKFVCPDNLNEAQTIGNISKMRNLPKSVNAKQPKQHDI